MRYIRDQLNFHLFTLNLPLDTLIQTFIHFLKIASCLIKRRCLRNVDRAHFLSHRKVMQFPDNFTYIPIKTSLPYKIDDIDDQQDKYKDTAIGKKYSPDDKKIAAYNQNCANELFFFIIQRMFIFCF